MTTQQTVDLRVREQVILEADGSVRRDEGAVATLGAGEGAASVGRDEPFQTTQTEGVAAQQNLRRLEAGLLADRARQEILGHLFGVVFAAVVDGVDVRHLGWFSSLVAGTSCQ